MNYRNETEKYLKESYWTIGKLFTRVIFPFLILGLVLSVWRFGCNIASQPAKVIEKTLDADNMIYNYEWFKQQYQNFEASNIKIDNAQKAIESFKSDMGPRKEWGYSDKQEYGRLNATLLGLKNHRESIVAEYNARSKMANRSIFKTELPEFIQ